MMVQVILLVMVVLMESMILEVQLLVLLVHLEVLIMKQEKPHAFNVLQDLSRIRGGQEIAPNVMLEALIRTQEEAMAVAIVGLVITVKDLN